MSDGLDDLTEKEKDTLRLIVRGHDAKSAARELDLSVHTINERLRASRRKLDVTSSREAARILLESEAKTHENLAYNQLGDAPREVVSDLPAPAMAPHDDAPRTRLSGAWVIGGIVLMSIFGAIIALSLAGSQAGPAEEAEVRTTENAKADAERENSARQWLALVDAEDWQTSFEMAGSAFRAPNTIATWQAASEQARGPLGDVIRREAISFETVAAPPRGYQVVRFRTDFQNQSGVIESVTLEREAGELRVVGYFLS
ncbi:MAG: DUF4019 domain-containing protein [Pseudomonadota bacterium]